MPATREKPAHKSKSLTVEAHSDLIEIRELWRTFERDAMGGPHDTWEWNDAWARTAAKSCTPQIVVGRDAAGDVLFLLPLTIRKHMGCAVLEWLGASQGNYTSGLFHPTAWQRRDLPRGRDLMAIVLAALPRVDAVHLTDQPAEIGKTLNPLAGLPGVKAASEGHTFPLSANWKTHFNKRFSSRQRSKLRRGERRLSEQGTLHFDVVEQGPDRLQVMDGIIGQKSQWLAEKGISDFFAEDDIRNFFRALVHIPDGDSGLTTWIFTLSIDDEIVATNLGLVYQNTFYGLIASTTDGPIRRHGPGKLLFLRLVEHLANEGIEMIDCGAGEDEDKLRWCTQRRQRQHAIVPVTAKGHAYAAALKAKLSAKLQIKQSPKLWSLAKRLRQWISPARLPAQINSPGSTASSLKA